MAPCSNLERSCIIDALRNAHVPCNKREIFREPDKALPALARYMRWYRQCLAEKADFRGVGTLQTIGPWAEEFGARILLMARPETAELQQAVKSALRDGSPSELLDRRLEEVFGPEFHLGDVTAEQIAEDLRHERGGFSPIPTPSVPPVIAALQRDRKMKSRVLALNAGGTSEQVGLSETTSDNVHILDLQEQQVAHAPCKSADEFWEMHFAGAAEAHLREADPAEATIVIGLAFPIHTFEDPETGRTDGHVIHFADKYDAEALGPRNAREAAGRLRGNGDPIALIASAREYLYRRTGKRFRRITLAPNDTNTAEIAFCTTPRAADRKTGGLVCGTGFNICSGDTNFEAGHYIGGFHYSTLDRIANALRGGGANDVECLCCGKIMSDMFLVAVRNCGAERLTKKVTGLSGKDRDILVFDLAYGRKPKVELDPVEFHILRFIAVKALERAEAALALMLSAVHRAKGTRVIFGEGSYVRKEPAFTAGVNRRIHTHETNLGEDLLAIEPLPVTFATPELQERHHNSLASSYVGSVLYGHGQNILDAERGQG